MDDYDVLSASDGCYGEAAHLVRRKFPLVSTILTWEMGSGTRNFKFFWGYYDIWLVVIFNCEEVLLIFAEMYLGCVDVFGEMLADES